MPSGLLFLSFRHFSYLLVSPSYFIRAVRVRERLRKHSCMTSTFPIASDAKKYKGFFC